MIFGTTRLIKDILGWRGFAQIASVKSGEGNVAVRFQGRTFDRRHQEVRVHVPYLVFQVIPIDPQQRQWSIVRREVPNLTSAVVIVGAVFQAGAWPLAPRSTHVDGRGSS